MSAQVPEPLDSPTQLLQLPPDILHRIAGHCWTSARQKLRCTCKALRTAALPRRVNISEDWMKQGRQSTLESRRIAELWPQATDLRVMLSDSNADQVCRAPALLLSPLKTVRLPPSAVVFVAGALVHWRQVQSARLPLNIALLSSLLASGCPLHSLELDDSQISGDGSCIVDEDSDEAYIPEEPSVRAQLPSCLYLLQQCSTLTKLDLVFKHVKLEADAWVALGMLTQLQDLRVRCEDYVQVTEGWSRWPGMQGITAAVRNLTRLTRLALSFKDESTAEEQVPGWDFGPLSGLRVLDLFVRNRGHPEELGAEALRGCPNLEVLILHHDPPDAPAIVSGLRNLVELSWTREIITDAMVLALADCPNLAVLKTWGLNITPSCVAVLPALRELHIMAEHFECKVPMLCLAPNLKSIVINAVFVGGLNMEALAHHPSLSYLEIPCGLLVSSHETTACGALATLKANRMKLYDCDVLQSYKGSVRVDPSLREWLGGMLDLRIGSGIEYIRREFFVCLLQELRGLRVMRLGGCHQDYEDYPMENPQAFLRALVGGLGRCVRRMKQLVRVELDLRLMQDARADGDSESGGSVNGSNGSNSQGDHDFACDTADTDMQCDGMIVENLSGRADEQRDNRVVDVDMTSAGSGTNGGLGNGVSDAGFPPLSKFLLALAAAPKLVEVLLVLPHTECMDPMQEEASYRAMFVKVRDQVAAARSVGRSLPFQVKFSWLAWRKGGKDRQTPGDVLDTMPEIM